MHGLARPEVAKLAVRESLLQLGLPEEGLSMESGSVLARFTSGRAVISSVATTRLSEASINKDIGAVENSRHEVWGRDLDHSRAGRDSL